MSSGSNDPKLLYAIDGIKAHHISNGSEQPLTPSGPQTLSLLMVPTSSPFADLSGMGGGTAAAEQDFYLHLHLPPELDLPMPATTQIYHQPPSSYLIPRWDLGPDSGAFTRLEFPAQGSRAGLQEDVDTFETILAQCTAFLERAPPPGPPPGPPPAAAGVPAAGVPAAGIPAAGEKNRGEAKEKVKGQEEKGKPVESGGDEGPLPAYNPADYDPGEGYVQGSYSSAKGGRIVLVDEEDGSVVGELSDGYTVVEDGAVRPGSKDPVEISLPIDGSQNISVQPVQDLEEEEALASSMHPAYKKSSIVSTATRASRLLITTSDYVSKVLQSQADNFTKTTKPAAKPVSFTPATHEHVRRINQLSTRAAGLSASTVGSISSFAQNLGASMGRRKDGRARGFDAEGNVIETYKPGVLNKSLMAFNTVVDGMEQAGRNLLSGTTSSVSTVVGHRWGPEAGELSRTLGGGVKNVALVYIDATGVSRRAILKSVARGMVVGKVRGGGQVIVGGEGNGNGNGNGSGARSSSSSSGGSGSSGRRGADPHGKRPVGS